ncbi:MAG: hypothetical protein EPN43_04020 [Jatrophihabitans sp.]|nr:MAG: hypothetical protein EPN43_04020 [Jatrophihabitans sp.]
MVRGRAPSSHCPAVATAAKSGRCGDHCRSPLATCPVGAISASTHTARPEGERARYPGGAVRLDAAPPSRWDGGMLVARIVCGGQSGVDRGAVDAAVACGIPYGGWCPLGGHSEDLPDVRVRYPHLRETPSTDVSQRTEWNVRDSDATLVICDPAVASAGTEFTVATARRLGRPLLVTCGPRRAIADWLRALPGEPTLNVAGPRASEWPDGYEVTTRLLLPLLRG